MKRFKSVFMWLLLSLELQSEAQTNKFPEDGNVGIGTAYPADKLHVFTNAKKGEIRIGGGNGSGHEGFIYKRISRIT